MAGIRLSLFPAGCRTVCQRSRLKHCDNMKAEPMTISQRHFERLEFDRQQEQLAREELARDLAYRERQAELGNDDRSPLTYFFSHFRPDIVAA